MSANVNSWPLYVAQRQGYLSELALDAEVTYTDSATRSVQVLASRDIDLVAIATDIIIDANERGAGFAMVGGSSRIPVYTLLARPEIRSYADLRGRLIGVTGPNVGEMPFLTKLLAAKGLREGDYDTITLGGPAQRLAATTSGAVAATMLNQPLDFRALDEGLVRLGLSTEVTPDYQFIAYAVRADWARENRDALVRLLRALRKADRWLYDPANAGEAARILAEASNLNEDYARRTYELLYRELRSMAEGSELSLTGLQTVMEFMADQGRLTPPLPAPDKYVDLSYLEAAARAE